MTSKAAFKWVLIIGWVTLAIMLFAVAIPDRLHSGDDIRAALDGVLGCAALGMAWLRWNSL